MATVRTPLSHFVYTCCFWEVRRIKFFLRVGGVRGVWSVRGVQGVRPFLETNLYKILHARLFQKACTPRTPRTLVYLD